MNETTLARLLNLYPVEALRENWDVKGSSKDEIIRRVVDMATEAEIAAFAREYHPITRQHCFILDDGGVKLGDIPAQLLERDGLVFGQRSKTAIEEFYLLPVDYEAIVGPPYSVQTLEFVWPVRIIVESNCALLMFTILEKNVETYVAPGLRAYNVHKVFDERSVIDEFSAVTSGGERKPLDLNRGIKALWRDDHIDSTLSRWKGSISTLSEVMDARHLLKRDQPAKYAEIIKAPLLKMVFVTVRNDLDYPSGFAVDATAGELIFSRYSKTLSEVENVVRAILDAN